MTSQVEKKPGEEMTLDKKGSEVLEDDMITIPPDGGYGWVVLIACFVSNSIDNSFILRETKTSLFFSCS